MPEDRDWTTQGLDYEPPEIDTSKAHSARIYDYLLGGKDNYPPDREAAEQAIKLTPGVVVTARQNRLFMLRAARYVAATGISQFLDIGTGIPTSPNLHEVAQGINPAARVVYVDNDPIVLAHAHARLISTPRGRVAYVHADMRDPGAVLAAPDLTATLDFGQPVALSILATLHLITDHAETHELLSRYIAPLAAGSFVTLSVTTKDGFPPEGANAVEDMLRARGVPILNRTHAEATALFDGLELIEPGVVLVNQWRPDPGSPDASLSEVGYYGGVARKH
jgi:hypothetical protein